MRRARGVVFAAVATLVALPGLIEAQTAQIGTVSGVVKDQSGGVLPGVSVTLTDQERGVSRSEVTDAKGYYLFAAVPIGTYTVSAAMAGFQTATIKGNLVETEKTTSVAVSLKVQGVVETLEVAGETPIVDATNTSVNTRIRSDAFERLPVGRSYQALMGATPGVVGTGNVNSHGALTGNNQFLFDGVDITDPTTGTFGGNLNFEAIQELSIYTSAISAEYGRAAGAVVNVITKSGTNKFAGSLKYLFQNDDWNAQNTTKSETTGASLSRVKFDHVNPTYDATLGGPIWKDHVWFFGTYENQKNTTAQRQTVGPTPENYQQTTTSGFWNVRVSAQISPKHNVWFKYHTSPTDGFVVDYWGASAQRTALTFQDQGATSKTLQYTGVLRSNWSIEAMAADNTEFINVYPFQSSSVTSGAPHFNLADNKYYNGATFDGSVNRPRRQATAATTYYSSLGGKNHSFKLGFDAQFSLKSSNLFKYPNSQLYIDNSYNQATNTFSPQSRRDYDAGPSASQGNLYAVYLRDKFEATKRLFAEAGLRFEKQSGSSDVGAGTVDTSTLSPRLSASYDVTGNGKTLIVGSYGRFYQSIIQNFSDAFAAIPQQTNYNNYVWNGSAYVFSNRLEVGASSFKPNLDLKPTYLDELTFGFQRQLGRYLGVGVRGLHRTWNNLIDDVRSFNPDRSVKREVVDYGPAERSFWGLEFTFDKRFSNNWNAQVSYTWSRVRGNHFDNTFSGLGDYLDAQCRTTVDPAVGTGGVIPCSTVQEGANKFGTASYDRPHSIKYNGAYSRDIGRARFTAGIFGDLTSKTTFTRNRAVNVLLPGTLTNAGPTATFFYEPLGSNRIPGMALNLDGSVEVAFRAYRKSELAFRAEIFNLPNKEEKTNVNNTVWCDPSTTSAACQTARSQFGTATARGSFQTPRAFRFTALLRF